MADTSTPNVSISGTFDRRDLYKSVRFQQGKPVLDTELNDAQDMTIEELLSKARLDQRFSGIETSPFEWAVMPANVDPQNTMNNDNFAVTIGRLPTRAGVIDTESLFTANDGDFTIAYDSFLLKQVGGAETIDYGNYVFKGKVSEVDATDPNRTFKDLSKNFESHHLLMETTTSCSFGVAPNLKSLNVKTGACRVVFTNALNQANVGDAYPLIVASGDIIKMENLLPAPVSIGDEYIIIPPNMLTSNRSAWDQASNFETIIGKEDNPLQLVFVNTWQEDISSDEDGDIQNANIGTETTHRTQLRWTVRIANVYGDAIYELASALSDSGEHETADDARSLLENLITTQEFAIGSNRDLEWNIGANGFTQQTLLLSAGSITEHDISEDNALSNRPQSILGVQKVSSPVLRKMGDDGLLNLDILKAILGLHTTNGSAVAYDRYLSDQLILLVCSSPSKRLHQEFLINGALASDLANFPNGAAPAVNSDSLSPRFWPNLDLAHQFDMLVIDTQDATVPRFWNRPRVSPNANGYYTHISGSDTFSVQPSVYVAPPRIFLKASDATSEIVRARQAFYGATPYRAMDQLRSVYAPLVLDRLSLAEGETLRQVLFNSLDGRLDSYDNALLAVIGQAGITQLRTTGNSPATQSGTLFRITPCANLLLGDDHAIGNASSGTTYRQADASSVSNNFIDATNYGDVRTFGTIDFEDPLYSANSQWADHNKGANLGGMAQLSQQDASYFVREKINGSNTVDYNDESLGWSRSKSSNEQRLWHEGIAQAKAFKDSFNLRKLAIKTSAHAEGDLFTIDQPLWFQGLDSFTDTLDLLSNSTVTPQGGPAYFDQSLYTAFDALKFGHATVLASSRSAIRSQRADVEVKGTMGISSAAGTSYAPTIGNDGFQALSKALGHTATNSTLLPFLSNISGSTSITRLDQGSSSNLDDVHQARYYDDIETSSAKMNEPLKGAWGRRELSLTRLMTQASSASSSPSEDRPLYMPSTSLDTNRATALRLRYHVGDFYPGELDANGVPSNLLVDSLNLFVRVEPLSFTHWMTMPKHQHSILEGSMDLSEAIATLLDISNGRGIPDHLYSLTASYASETDDSDFLFIDSDEGNVIPRSALDLESFALSKNEPRLIRNDQTLTLLEAHSRYYNSEIAIAFRALAINLFSVPNNGQGANGTDIIFGVIAGSEVDITAVVPTGNNPFPVASYFQAIGIEANNGQYSILSKWVANPEWKILFDRWASRRNRPLSAEVLTNPALTETALKDFYLDVANHLKDILSSFLFNSSTLAKDLDGLIDAGALRSDTLYEAIADLQAPNNPATSGLATTTPIISEWLSKLSPTALKRMYPALAGARDQSNNPNALPVVSALSLKALTDLIQTQVNQDGELKDSSGSSVTLTDFFRDLLETNAVQIGSVDPVAVCIPSNAQPYIHWWHPNMDALQAPGGEDGFWLNSTEGNTQNSDDTRVRYQAYPEWSRESMVYTGIVPISDRLTARARGIMSNQLGISNWRNVAGFNESSSNETDADTDNSAEQINALRLFNGITGLFPGSDSEDGFVPAVESFYKTAFDYNAALGSINPHGEGFRLGDNSDADPEGNSFNYIPYFSHSTGVLGFGGLNLPSSVGFADGLDYEENNYTGQLNAQQYNSWANWFPYLPSVTHQYGDSFNNTLLVANSGTATNTIKDRLVRTVFHQATRPVYLPASMSVIDNVNTNAAHQGTASFTPISGYDASSRNEDNQYAYNAGYNPLISNPRLEVMDNNDPRDAYYDVRGLPYDANTLRVLQALDSSRLTGFNGRTEVTDNDFSEIIPDSLPHTEPFSGAALRSGLKTDTLAWINLYVKTYSRTYGHNSIHPYSYLDDADDRPSWHIDFADSRGIVSGKGPDKDVDTLMMGDMGTNVFVTRRSVFLDPLCLGVGATRQDGTLVHDSDNDSLREDNLTFRDIFDMCGYERQAKGVLMTSEGTTLNQGLLYTSSMWSKLGMQTKLMLNSSIRVLHNRPGGAIALGGAALNYGGLSSPTKSLTEMFLAVDAETNQLKRLPRTNLTSPSNKPYIHLESMIDTGDISNLGGSRLHPNFKWMKPLKRMVSTNLSGGANQDGVQFRNSEDLQLKPTNNTSDVKQYWLEGENALVQSGSTSEAAFERSLIPSHTGDTFASDPFDTLWDLGAGITEVHSPVANSAQNSGVEYELLSSLGRMHEQASSLRLNAPIGLSSKSLNDSVVTPNELTLPGDHEIVFVLYTGNHGQSFAEDLPEGINPPVAGCHIKASIEVNRPSERTDSPHLAEHINERAIHYGVQTPSSQLPFSASTRDEIKIVPQGLMTFSVAGGRPTLDNTVYDEDGNEI